MAATFFVKGREHAPVSSIGTGWQTTPWAAVQQAGVVEAPVERARKHVQSLGAPRAGGDAGRAARVRPPWPVLRLAALAGPDRV